MCQDHDYEDVHLKARPEDLRKVECPFFPFSKTDSCIEILQRWDTSGGSLLECGDCLPLYRRNDRSRLLTDLL